MDDGMTPAGPRRDAIVLAFPVILAGLLAWCAVPSAIADGIMLPHRAVLARARAGLAVSPEALDGAAKAGAAAARWSEKDRHLTDAAIALLAAPRHDAGRARAVLTEALAARPMDDRNWLRLASVRAADDRAGARAAWMMALATAPFDPPAIRPSLAIGFALLPTRDTAFVARLARQVRVAARIDPVALAETARARGAEPFVYASLFDEPELSWRFELALAGAARSPTP